MGARQRSSGRTAQLRSQPRSTSRARAIPVTDSRSHAWISRNPEDRDHRHCSRAGCRSSADASRHRLARSSFGRFSNSRWYGSPGDRCAQSQRHRIACNDATQATRACLRGLVARHRTIATCPARTADLVSALGCARDHGRVVAHTWSRSWLAARRCLLRARLVGSAADALPGSRFSSHHRIGNRPRAGVMGRRHTARRHVERDADVRGHAAGFRVVVSSLASSVDAFTLDGRRWRDGRRSVPVDER